MCICFACVDGLYICMQIHEHYICPNQAHIYITFVPANIKRNKSKSGQVFFCLAHVLLEALNLENEPSRAIDRRYITKTTNDLRNNHQHSQSPHSDLYSVSHNSSKNLLCHIRVTQWNILGQQQSVFFVVSLYFVIHCAFYQAKLVELQSIIFCIQLPLVVDHILEVKVNITAGVINLIRQITILFDRTNY